MDLSNLTVIVDDNQITYDDPAQWHSSGVSNEFDTSTHQATNAGASFTFIFSGTDVAVFGTIQNGLQNVQTQYVLDGGPTNTTTAPNLAALAFGQNFYQSSKLEAGSHTLQVKRLDNQELFFDYITYTPSELDNSMTVIVDDSDSSAVKYDDDGDQSRWKKNGVSWEWKSGTHQATVAGATLRFPFNGTDVSVYGTIDANVTGGSVNFAIDDDSPSTWTVPTNAALSFHNQFWQSSSLDAGEHTLEVTVLNTGGFYFDYFLYHPTPYNSSSGNATASSGSQSDDAGSSSSSNVGAIVGGVVGGIAGLGILAGLLFFFWRQQENRGVAEGVYDSEKNYSSSAPYGAAASYSNTPPQQPTTPPYSQAQDPIQEPLLTASMNNSTERTTGPVPHNVAFPVSIVPTSPAGSQGNRSEWRQQGGTISVISRSEYSQPSEAVTGFGGGSDSGQTQYRVQNQGDANEGGNGGRPLPRPPKALYVPQEAQVAPRQHEDGGVRLQGPVADIPPAYNQYD